VTPFICAKIRTENPSWEFFNTIFEQKEYVEHYVMEVISPSMIAKAPSLLAEFEPYLEENREIK